MIWMLLAWFFLGEPRISLRLQPAIVMRDGSVRLWCRVPRHPDNRHLWLELQDVRRSYRQLDGESASVLYDLVVDRIPCLGDGRLLARCELLDNLERRWLSQDFLTVAGCGSRWR